jgi:glycosyltransferase involved in cell wall biosynthesis
LNSAPKPQVLHISTVHPADDVRIYHKECMTLAAHDYNVTLLARQPTQPLPASSIRVELLPDAKSRLVRAVALGWRAYRFAVRHPAAIVHFHDPEFIGYALLLALTGRKVIYDVHEDVPRDILSKRWIASPLRRVVAVAAEITESIASRFLNTVSATPDIHARFATRRGHHTVVRNYPLLSELLPADATKQATATSSPDRQGAVYVGRISFDRGLREMCDACTEANTPLNLAGPIGAAESEYLKNHLGKQRGLITWHGVLGRDAVAQLLQRSKIGLCVLHDEPNYRQALPIKLFEYMAHSLPVIASDLPVMRQVVESADCGWIIPPADHASLCTILKQSMHITYNSIEAGLRGRAAVQLHYNWETEARSLLGYYTRLSYS